MSDDTDRIKERIRKLLQLAGDDAAMGNEIENALRFARRLMLEHHISEADLRATEAKDPHEIAAVVEATEYDRGVVQTTGSRLTAWESALVTAVCELVGTVGWYVDARRTLRRSPHGFVQIDGRTGKPQTSAHLAIYGPAEDVRDALDLVSEWSLIIAGLGRLRYGGAFRGEGRAYCEGFARELLLQVFRMRDQERQAVPAEGCCSALVVANATALMDAKRARAAVYLREQLGIRLHASGGGRGGADYPEAARRGASDGSRASFTRVRTSRLDGGG